MQRAREHLAELNRYQVRNHLHFQVREFMIRIALQQADRPVVVIGDSITEMARLPETIDERPVVNAGVGGATIEDFQRLGPDLLHDAKPSFVAVALGTNNVGSNSIRQNYADLLKKLKKYSPRLLAVAVPPRDGSDQINPQIKDAAESEGVPFLEMPLPEGSTIADRIHLNAAGYSKWTPAIVSRLSRELNYPSPKGPF